MTNRYDRAAEAPIINTYVPINFDLLYKIGKEQGDIVRKLAEQMTEAIQKFGEFSSISDLDVQDYYNSSTGKLAGLINEAAANPDKLKDAAWRSKFQLGLNSIDYNHLANLRKSAENMDTREKAKAALRAEGLYADWFDDPAYADLRNWSTRDSGVMTNISPDKYVSMEQLGRDYVKDLKPTFYKGKAPNSGASMPYTNWMAISSDDVRRSLNDHADDILSTTAGQRHFDRFAKMYLAQNPNASAEDIRESFIDALTVEQSDKMIETPVIDQASLSLALQASRNEAYEKRYNNSGPSKPAKGLSWFTNVYQQLMRDQASKADIAKDMNPTLAQQIKNSDMANAKAIRDLYEKFVNNPDTSKAMALQLKQLVDNGYVSNKDLQEGTIGLDLIQTMMMGAANTLGRDNPLQQEYINLQNGIIQNTKDQTDKLATELALGTFRSYNNIKQNQNPLIDAFTNVSSNVLRASDDGLLSAFGDPQLEKDAQNAILNQLFGTDEKGRYMLEFDDYRNAKSSFDFLYSNYTNFENEVNAALAKVPSYTKKGIDGETASLIGNVDPVGIGDLDTYSVRNSLAAGKYGKCEITGIRGFTKVNGADPNEYAFQVTVKVPIERIRDDMNTWSEIDLDELWKQEGLHGFETDEEMLNEKGKKVSAKKEYVEVPMVINKKLAGRNAYALDALFNKTTATTPKNKQASLDLAITNYGVDDFIYLDGQ